MGFREFLLEQTNAEGAHSAIMYRNTIYHGNGIDHLDLMHHMFKAAGAHSDEEQDRLADKFKFGMYHPQKTEFRDDDYRVVHSKGMNVVRIKKLKENVDEYGRISAIRHHNKIWHAQGLDHSDIVDRIAQIKKYDKDWKKNRAIYNMRFGYWDKESRTFDGKSTKRKVLNVNDPRKVIEEASVEDGKVSAIEYNGKIYHGGAGYVHHSDVAKAIYKKFGAKNWEQADRMAEQFKFHYIHPKTNEVAVDGSYDGPTNKFTKHFTADAKNVHVFQHHEIPRNLNFERP